MLAKKRIPLLLAIIATFIYGLLGTLVSLHRYWQYETFYFDFGIFDKALWSVSRFSLPIIDHYALGERIIFADHFSPSLFLLSPLFWIFPWSETLLVVQATAAALSGLVLFLIGQKLLKNQWFALGLTLIYFLFVGLQNAVITDFHEVTVATLVFMLTMYVFVRRDKRMFYLFFMLLLGFKESLFLLGCGISVAVFLLEPKWRKTAGITFLISLLWGVIAIKGIIPFFSDGAYIYTNELPVNPVKVASAFFDESVKRQTLWNSLRSFGFLPLISPAFYVMLFQDFLIRFYAPLMTLRWGLAFHYSALTGAIMGVSSIYAWRFLEKRIATIPLSLFMFILLINALFLYRVTLRGPFALGYNPAFYAHSKDFTYLDKAFAKLGCGGSVMTQNNLAPHLTHRKVWLMLSDSEKYPVEYYTLKKPDYILLDVHPGQNPNNFFGIKDMTVLLSNLNADSNYRLISSEGGQLVYVRKPQSFTAPEPQKTEY